MLPKRIRYVGKNRKPFPTQQHFVFTYAFKDSRLLFLNVKSRRNVSTPKR